MKLKVPATLGCNGDFCTNSTNVECTVVPLADRADAYAVVLPDPLPGGWSTEVYHWQDTSEDERCFYCPECTRVRARR